MEQLQTLLQTELPELERELEAQTVRNECAIRLLSELINVVDDEQFWRHPGRCNEVLAELEVFIARFEHEISGPSSWIPQRVERAFVHLQRAIIADPDTGLRWRRAFKYGEVPCEKLGGAHLLSHGIWAFKAHTARERTDLILAEQVVPDEVRATGSGLVLTEWKVAKERGLTPQKAVEQAHRQASIYAGSGLAGIELVNVRYLVVVTRHRKELNAPPEQDGIQYRVINIAVEPKTPSQSAKAAKK